MSNDVQGNEIIPPLDETREDNKGEIVPPPEATCEDKTGGGNSPSTSLVLRRENPKAGRSFLTRQNPARRYRTTRRSAAADDLTPELEAVREVMHLLMEKLSGDPGISNDQTLRLAKTVLQAAETAARVSKVQAEIHPPGQDALLDWYQERDEYVFFPNGSPE